ncbi:hypothetical protein B0H15DRAFT_488736 [Mycena belliarum]|uniref:Uncharacterized protein n=1 Tax=Mycena belliarum TaxID=1033014 RepID=A0AAD6XQ89_9AGAR|nr:hypothetical protein B0H15DRAFT_488736 [Mycena belliae]
MQPTRMTHPRHPFVHRRRRATACSDVSLSTTSHPPVRARRSPPAVNASRPPRNRPINASPPRPRSPSRLRPTPSPSSFSGSEHPLPPPTCHMQCHDGDPRARRRTKHEADGDIEGARWAGEHRTVRSTSGLLDRARCGAKHPVSACAPLSVYAARGRRVLIPRASSSSPTGASAPRCHPSRMRPRPSPLLHASSLAHRRRLSRPPRRSPSRPRVPRLSSTHPRWLTAAFLSRMRPCPRPARPLSPPLLLRPPLLAPRPQLPISPRSSPSPVTSPSSPPSASASPAYPHASSGTTQAPRPVSIQWKPSAPSPPTLSIRLRPAAQAWRPSPLASRPARSSA